MSGNEMSGSDQPRRRPLPPDDETRLNAAATEFYADLRLTPLLRQLLVHSSSLVNAVAGSISLVDATRGRYAKLAEHGASCQLGRSFPLEQGVTGQVMALRRPVALASYNDIRNGHLRATDPARSGAVAAVPIWWRGEVIGANVVFAGRRPRFTTAEVDELEVMTQIAASGIVRAGASEPSLAHLIRHRPQRHDSGSGPDPSPESNRSSNDAPPREPSPFTPREREVACLLARGLSDRDIAAALVISPKTTEKHVGALLRKTGTTSRTAAVIRALERGWTLSGDSMRAG